MNTGPGPLAVLMLFAGGIVAMSVAIIAAKAAARRALRLDKPKQGEQLGPPR